MAGFGGYGQSGPSYMMQQNNNIDRDKLQRDFQDLSTLPPLMQKEVIKVVTKQHYYMSSRRAKLDLITSFNAAQAAAEQVYNANLAHRMNGQLNEALNYAVMQVVSAMSEIRDPKDIQAIDIVFQGEIKAKKLLLSHLMNNVCPGMGGGAGTGSSYSGSYGSSQYTMSGHSGFGGTGGSHFGGPPQMHFGGRGSSHFGGGMGSHFGGRGGSHFGGGGPRNLNMRHTRPMGGGRGHGPHGGFGGGYKPKPRGKGGRSRGAGPGRGGFGGRQYKANEDDFGDDYQYDLDMDMDDESEIFSVYDEDEGDGLEYYYRSGQSDHIDDFYGRRRLMGYGEDNEFMGGSGGMDSGLILRVILFIGFIGLICLIAVVYRFRKRKYRMERTYREIHVPLMAEAEDNNHDDDDDGDD